MPITPKVAMGWIEVFKTGGPYVVIIALLIALWLIIRFALKLFEENTNLNKARVTDLTEILKDSREDTKNLTAAITELSTLVKKSKNGTKSKEPSSGSS